MLLGTLIPQVYGAYPTVDSAFLLPMDAGVVCSYTPTVAVPGSLSLSPMSLTYPLLRCHAERNVGCCLFLHVP